MNHDRPNDELLRAHDRELARLAAPLRRHALALLLAAAVAGAATYALTARTPPQYQASSSLMLVDPLPTDPLTGALPQAPGFPPGALARALYSDAVLQDIGRELRAAGQPAASVQALERQLRLQAAGGGGGPLSVSLPDGERSALYQVQAQTGTPGSAKELADAGAAALLRWDQRRVSQRLREARAGLTAQLAALQGQPGSAAAQQGLRQSIARLSALGTLPAGSLEVVAEAREPAAPVSPRPLRSALLAALLALFAAGGGALGLDALRRRVHGEESLQGLAAPLLGHLPARGSQAGAHAVRAASRDGAGLLRVNLQSRLPEGGAQRLVFSGMGTARSTGDVVAALAASFAATGKRVLVVDAGEPAPGAWTGPASDEPVPVSLPGGRVELLRAPGGGAQPGAPLGAHDLVLVQAPPLLRGADAAALAQQAAGLVLVVDRDATSLREVERALELAHTARLRVIGLVLSDPPPGAAPRLPTRRSLGEASAPTTPGD